MWRVSRGRDGGLAILVVFSSSYLCHVWGLFVPLELGVLVRDGPGCSRVAPQCL